MSIKTSIEVIEEYFLRSNSYCLSLDTCLDDADDEVIEQPFNEHQQDEDDQSQEDQEWMNLWKTVSEVEDLEFLTHLVRRVTNVMSEECLSSILKDGWVTKHVKGHD